MRKLIAMVACALLVGLIAAPAWAEKHRNEKLGFELVHPKKWQPMPLSPDEKFMVAKFVSARTYEFATKDGYYTWHKPYLDVVVIARDLGGSGGGGATVTKTDDGVRVEEDSPYKNLKEYLDKTCRRLGGFHFSAEKEATVNGMKVRQYEITVDKLVDAPRKVYGWEFETEDAYYGLVGESLEKETKKVGKMILSAFKSFKTFPRTGNLPNAPRTGEDIVVKGVDDDEDEEELSDEQLKEKRDRATALSLSKIKDSLGKGWAIKESKNYIAVSHADKKYTKELLRHSEAMLGWMEKKLGYVGTGYVGKVIIRICANSEEHTAYQNSRGWFSDAPEIVTYKDRDGWSDWAMESLNRGLLDAWFKDKNENLRWGAPRWFSSGLSSFIEGAKSKGSKVTFKADTWDNVQLANLRRGGKLLSAKSFFTMTSEDMWSDYENHRQTQYFVTFLLAGSGSKGKYKHVLPTYLKSLIFMLDEAALAAAEKEPEGPAKGPQTEEEEDQMFQERQEAWRNQEAATLETLLERSFEGWTEKDWNKFDASYQKEIK